MKKIMAIGVAVLMVLMAFVAIGGNVSAGTDSWQIGDFEPDTTTVTGKDEFANTGMYTSTFHYYVGTDTVGEMPEGIEYINESTYGEINIHFSVLTPGIFHFEYGKYGSETDDIYLDNEKIDSVVGAGEGVWSEFLTEMEIFDRDEHTITVKVTDSGHDSAHWFDYFKFYLEKATDEKISLGRVQYVDSKSKVNAEVKYKTIDSIGDGVKDTLVLDFQTVYFAKENHDVQWLAYFIVPNFYDYYPTDVYIWGKIFKPGRGGYTGEVVIDTNGWLFHGDVWDGGQPTGDSSDALVFADVDDGGGLVNLETRMKFIVHQTIELPLDYTGTITLQIRGVSGGGGPYWEEQLTIGTL